MSVELPRYTGRDYRVLALCILPITVVMNTVIFGARYFSHPLLFLEASLLTGAALSLDFVLCGGVAVLLKQRFQEEREVGKRLTLMILVFLLITGLFLLIIFRGYELIGFWGYRFNENGFIWSYIVLGIINIFLTFLLEGVARYEKWEANLRETEKLRLAYRQSQIEALKSQVNPHFLFNSLNSLSSLINEDEERAEKFLNEMSKVYRYMLRNDDEQLVPLSTEMEFLHSYLYLLQTRYGEGLQVRIDVSEPDLEKTLPPLSLQVVVENAITQNTISRSAPLEISFSSDGTENCLIICNAVQPKTLTEAADSETGLDNLVTKYELLNKQKLRIDDYAQRRCIWLPLFAAGEKEVMV